MRWTAPRATIEILAREITHLAYRVTAKWYGTALPRMSPWVMGSDYRACDEHMDEKLRQAAAHVLESLECLLYLIGKDAASPEQIEAYVNEANEVLGALRIRMEQERAPRRPFLVM